MTLSTSEASPLNFGDSRLCIEDIADVAHRARRVSLSEDAAFRARVIRGAAFVDALIARDGVIYGVTTGYGDSVTVPIPRLSWPSCPRTVRLPWRRLGPAFGDEETRAILAARLASLARGYSGVSLTLLDALRVPAAPRTSCRSSPKRARWAPAAI